MPPLPDRVRRVGRLAIVLAVAIELLWLAGMNLFLNTSPLRSLVNGKPEKVRIEWTRAWSLWPGDLRVRGFVVRGDNATTQWVLEIDRAQAQIGLLALLDKRFLAKGLDAEGVVFHHRRHPLTPEQLAKEPVIAPIPWARYEIQPAPAPTTEPKSKPRASKRVWAVDLRGIAGTVRELWIEEYRWQGSGTLSGGVFIRASERLTIGDSRIELDGGIVTLGEEKALEPRSVRLDLRSPDIDLGVHRGLAVLAKLRGRLALESGVANVRFVDFYLGKFPGVALRSGPGGLFVDVTVDDDGIGTGAIDLRGTGVVAEYEGVRLRGDLRIDGRLRRWNLEDSKIDVSGTRGEVSDVVLVDAGGNKKDRPWWGKVALTKATLDLGSDFHLTGTASAEIANSRPILSLLELHAGKDLPKKLEDAMNVSDVRGAAELRASTGSMTVSKLEIDGDELEIRARLRLQEDRKESRAIAYVKRGAFSIGLERGGAKTVKITHPKKWFEEHSFLAP